MSPIDTPLPTLAPERPDTITEREAAAPRLSHGDGDHERFAHYVRKNKIMESAVEGTPLVALCGKVWVPSRDPQRFPVCPECDEIYKSMRGGDGSDKPAE